MSATSRWPTSFVPLLCLSKMYFSKVQNIFVWVAKCICLNSRMHLCQFQNVLVYTWKYESVASQWPATFALLLCLFKLYLSDLLIEFVLIVKCICLNWKMYLSKHENMCQPHQGGQPHLCCFYVCPKCISQKCRMYLSELPIFFVWIPNCICPKFKMYLSKHENMSQSHHSGQPPLHCFYVCSNCILLIC